MSSAASAAVDHDDDDGLDPQQQQQQQQQDDLATTATTVAVAVAAAQGAAVGAVSAVVLEELERQYVAVSDERDLLRQQLLERSAALSESQQLLAAQRVQESAVSELQFSLGRSEQKAASYALENQTLSERMDRMQAESDTLREEISRLTASNAELANAATSAEIQAKLKESDAIPLHHEKVRLERELDSVTAHAKWLEQELQAKQHDYQHLQQDSRDRAIQLQLQKDQTANELTAAEAKLSVQFKLERDLQDKLKQVTRDNLDLKLQLQQQQETADTELQEERRLIELQREHLTRWQQRYDDVVREHETLKRTAQQALAASDDELERAKEQLEEKYAAILQEQATSFESKVLLLQQQQQQRGPHPPDATRLLLAAAAPAQSNVNEEGDDEQGPVLNMTDLYEKWEECKSALRSEVSQRKRWQFAFQRVQKEIAQKAPEMIRQRQEYEMAVSQLQDYQSRLSSVIQERDDAVADSREAAQEVVAVERRLSERKAEAQDLAKQVQALLLSRSGGSADSSIPVTIQEIQNQNQRLLVDHRRLTQQVAELEGRLQSDMLKSKLDAAEHEMNALQQERKEQDILVEKIVQQRDLYRALLFKHDSAVLGESAEDMTALDMAKQQSERAKKYEHLNQELEGNLKAVQAEMERATRDKEGMAERLARYEAVNAELTSSMNLLERDLLLARGADARSESDAAYHKEKCERLEESLDRARGEIAQVNHARSDLQKINADLQSSVSSTNAERARLEGEKRHAEAKVRLIEVQLATARAAEARQSDDNRQLRAEIASQGALIESIRRIEASLSAKTEGEKETIQRDLESVTRKLESAETKYSVQAENLTGRIAELEARIQDLQSSNQKHQTDSLQAKKALLDAKTELQSLNVSCKSVEAQLRAAKRKLGEEDEEADDAELSMQVRIDSLEADLEIARVEIASLQERADNYQAMAKASEKALSEVQEAAEAFRAEQGKENEDLKKLLENSQKSNVSRQEIIRDLTNDLAGQRGERQKSEQELQAQILSLMTEIQNNDKDVESAKASAAALKHDIETLRNDATVAQNNYERELNLHSQARTALRAAQESVDEETHRRKVAEEKLVVVQKELDQQHAVWEQEKSYLQEASKLLEQSVREAREQNNVLHSQLETLNDMVEKSQASRIAAAGSESGHAIGNADSQKVVSELREVVRFLRSENELLQTQLDTAKRAADREKAAANVVHRSLEEARSELKELQSEDNAVGISGEADKQEISEKLRVSEEQLELLKDSNKLLREEVDKLRSKLSSTQTELSSVKKSAQPAEDVQRELGMKISSLEAEKQSLERELESWKGRMTSLVSNFNQIDPEEHRLLQKRVEEMSKASETHSAWKRATEEENTRIRTIAKKLNVQSREYQKTIETQKQEMQQLSVEKATLANASSANSSVQQERDELKQRITKMEKDAESAKTELDGANSRNDRLREKLREFQTVIRELRAKEKTLTEQLTAAKAAASSAASEAAKTASASSSVEKAPAAQAVVIKKPESFTQKEQSEPAPKPELSQEKKEPNATQAPDVSIPSVPSEGFQFGPSKGAAYPVADKKASAQLPTTTLRPVAEPFVPGASPSAETKPSKTATPVAQTPVAVSAEANTAQADIAAAKSPAPLLAQQPASTEAKPAATPGVENLATAGAVTRRMSGDKKEQEFKQKLLEKKRQLAEALRQTALKRKQEAEKASVQVAEATAKDEQVAKKAKTEQPAPPPPPPAKPVESEEGAPPATKNAGRDEDINESTPAPVVEAPQATSAAAAPVEAQAIIEVIAVAETPEEEVAEGVGMMSEAEAPEEDIVGNEEDDDADIEVEESGEGMDDSAEPKKPDTPFGVPTFSHPFHPFAAGAASNPFGVSQQPSTTFGTATFGQSSTVAAPFASAAAPGSTFGSAATPSLANAFGFTSAESASSLTSTAFGVPSTFGHAAPVTTFGGAFLDIKPPGSTTVPPTFTFGNSGSNITLPTPSLPPTTASAPFGAFGTFGGGFGAPSASMQARPLFGAAPVAAGNDEEEVMQDDDDDNNGGGDMDARD